MAKNKRGRSYKFTPRRQAALRKAQARSAATRRRRVGSLTKVAGATLAVGAVAYGARRYSSSRPKGSRKAKTSKALVHVPGLGVNHTAAQMKTTVIPLGWGKPGGDFVKMKQIRSTPQTIFKVDKSGLVSRTTKNRMKYDTNRRRKYWQAKPVGGAPRKPYTSTKRGRR
jgi:hypothetical protein